MRSINSPDPLQIMQDGHDFMAYLFEQNTWFHLFPIDGRPHTKGIPTWFGDSVGHWEGDTLVIETVNFNGKTRLDTNGHPHSDQLSADREVDSPRVSATLTTKWIPRSQDLHPGLEDQSASSRFGPTSTSWSTPAKRTTKLCMRAASRPPSTTSCLSASSAPHRLPARPAALCAHPV